MAKKKQYTERLTMRIAGRTNERIAQISSNTGIEHTIVGRRALERGLKGSGLERELAKEKKPAEPKPKAEAKDAWDE